MQPDNNICEWCQERITSTEDLALASLSRTVQNHLQTCAACREFLEDVRLLHDLGDAADHCAAPEPLLLQTAQAIATHLQERARAQRQACLGVIWRLTLVAIVALPLILGLYGLIGYLVYAWLGSVSRLASLILIGQLAGVALFGLSLFYGALPILGKVALELRQPAFAPGSVRVRGG